MEWVQMIALAAIWFWAGYTFGSGQMRKRTKGDVDAIASIACTWARLDRNARCIGPGSRVSVTLPATRNGVDLEMVLSAQMADRKHKEAGK